MSNKITLGHVYGHLGIWMAASHSRNARMLTKCSSQVLTILQHHQCISYNFVNHAQCDSSTLGRCCWCIFHPKVHSRAIIQPRQMWQIWYIRSTLLQKNFSKKPLTKSNFVTNLALTILWIQLSILGIGHESVLQRALVTAFTLLNQYRALDYRALRLWYQENRWHYSLWVCSVILWCYMYLISLHTSLNL